MRLPSNLSNRVQRRVHTLIAYARYRFGLSEPDPGTVAIDKTFRHPIDAHQRIVITSQYRTLFPTAVETELAEAQRLLNHQFSLLGHDMEYDNRIAWSRDPVSRRDWDHGFSPKIPYRGPARLGDIKLPWELNKHQYFFTLGKAAWLENDPGFALEIMQQIDHWIDDNPVYRGIHWISALETGTRAVSWIMAYPFYAEYSDAPFRHRLTRSLAQHMQFVENNLSLGEFTNTHLVGEAAALVAGGLFLKCRQSRRWISKGLEILEQEIVRQVAPDGVHVEQSVAYHRFFLDHYFLVHGLLAANNRSLPLDVLRKMECMTEFLMDIIYPNGSAPAFGDGDDARGIWFRANCPEDFRSLLALGAVIFDRGDFKKTAKTTTEEVFWLLGNSGVEKFHNIPEQLPDHTSAAYPNGGYYIMRGGWSQSDPVLAFDCGPLGRGPAGHGHADALSFQLYANSYPCLVDVGTFSYNLDYAWRDTFRSTRSHNTIVIDGLEQSVPGERMSWESKAETCSHNWITTPWFDLIDAEHDGYRRLPDPLTHRRVVIFLKPDIWCICDHLQAQTHHHLDFLLHLHPDCSVEQAGDAAMHILRTPQGKRLNIWTPQKKGITEIVNGDEKQRSAWFSPEYGTRIPTRVIRYQSEFTEQLSLVTFLSTSDCSVSSLATENYLQKITIRRQDNTKETIFYRLADKQPAEQDGICFDGSLLYSRKTTEFLPTVWAAKFRKLSITDILTVHSVVPIHSLTLTDGQCQLTLPPEHVADLKITVNPNIQLVINN